MSGAQVVARGGKSPETLLAYRRAVRHKVKGVLSER
jgi:hypothetical protein